MKSKVLIISALIILGFIAFFHYTPSKKQILANKIRMNVSKTLETQKDLHPIGSGGRMLYKIEMLNLGFEYFNEIDIPTARNLLIYSTETFLNQVNENPEIRPYLSNYPFTPTNIEIDIWIYRPNHSEVDQDKLRFIRAKEGILQYYTQKSDNFTAEPLLEETFTEALKK